MNPGTYKKLVSTAFTTDFRKAAEVVETPFLEPGLGEVVVKNVYAGVNATDVNITAGRYDPDASPPFDLGAEAAGMIVAVGSAVTHVKEGDAVVTFNLGGGYREYNLLPARQFPRRSIVRGAGSSLFSTSPCQPPSTNISVTGRVRMNAESARVHLVGGVGRRHRAGSNP